MADNYRNISAALSSALNTLATTLAIDVAWENSAFEPTVGESYLRETLLPAETALYTFDSQTENVGIYQVDVFTPINDGKGAAIALADDIADAFENQTLIYGTTTVYTRSASRAVATRERNWHILPVSIAYRSIITSR